MSENVTSSPAVGRALVGKILLVSALVMAAFSLAFWLEWIPVAGPVRGIAALALLIGALGDLAIGLRFVGESGS